MAHKLPHPTIYQPFNFSVFNSKIIANMLQALLLGYDVLKILILLKTKNSSCLGREAGTSIDLIMIAKAIVWTEA